MYTMNQKSIKFDDFGPILLFEVQIPICWDLHFPRCWKTLLLLHSSVIVKTAESNILNRNCFQMKLCAKKRRKCSIFVENSQKLVNWRNFWSTWYVQTLNNRFKWMKVPVHLSYYHLRYISHRARQKWAIFTTKYRVKCAKISLKEGKWPKKKRSSLAPRSHSGFIKLVFSYCTSLWEYSMKTV